MGSCFFVSDLHGRRARYETLFCEIEQSRPHALFLGGDLLPAPYVHDPEPPGFVAGYLARRFEELRDRLGTAYPAVFVIPGNDDGHFEEDVCQDAASRGLWKWVHGKHTRFGTYDVFGYAYVPPTPFRLKDWERYDVSAYVDPGCVRPEEGVHTAPVVIESLKYATIARDLDALAGERSMQNAVILFHTPPYRTKLDRAALDGKSIDHVPLDVNVGSIAVKRFIEARQPLLTLHGHVHESTRLTGSWRDQLGRTHMFNAAHDGPELSLIRFDLEDLEAASRQLL